MYLILQDILDTAAVDRARTLLHDVEWIQGRATAGDQAQLVKNNLQLPHEDAAATQIREMVLAGLHKSSLFFSAALPKKIFPPRVNRYDPSHPNYGWHIDNAVMNRQATGLTVRTDLSCTVFLSKPSDYEGGELVIRDRDVEHAVKLPAGSAVLYSGATLHQVREVTHGARHACFFWIESMVRDGAQRQLLHELDMSLVRLRTEHGELPEAVAMTGTYHNLLRMWADSQ
jgi:PKHD-type hydroxylase